MTLKDIVAYINLLDSLNIHAETQETVRLLDSVLHVVNNHSVQLDSYSKNLEQNFSSITVSVVAFSYTLSQLQQRYLGLLRQCGLLLVRLQCGLQPYRRAKLQRTVADHRRASQTKQKPFRGMPVSNGAERILGVLVVSWRREAHVTVDSQVVAMHLRNE